ncbi:unnamed protein product [Closterium sp. NIES-53]
MKWTLMDSSNNHASPPPRCLKPDPFARLSDDLVTHILALVASNGFSFLPKLRVTTATAATSGTTTATSAAAAAVAVTVATAEANADGHGSGGSAAAERDDGMVGSVGNAVNGSVNSEDEDAHDDASKDEF